METGRRRVIAELDARVTPLIGTARFLRPENALALTDRPRSDVFDLAIRARLLRCRPEALAVADAEMSAIVDRAVDELLADPGDAEAIGRVVTGVRGPLLAVGDSITADHLSWAEMLARALRRTGVETPFVNLAVGGGTTGDLLARLSTIEAVRPGLVFVMAGTNDARRHGCENSVRMAAPETTVRNLRRFGDHVVDRLGAALVLITPPPIDEVRVSACADFVAAAVSWRADDVIALQALIRGQSRPLVDVAAAFAKDGRASLLTADGVHPTVTGQLLIARTVVRALGAAPSTR